MKAAFAFQIPRRDSHKTRAKSKKKKKLIKKNIKAKRKLKKREVNGGSPTSTKQLII